MLFSTYIFSDNSLTSSISPEMIVNLLGTTFHERKGLLPAELNMSRISTVNVVVLDAAKGDTSEQNL